MKKYSKKIALILVLSLTLAFAIPALAQDTVIKGKYEEPKIAVLLPGNTEAIVNPLELPVSIKSDDGDDCGKVEGSQIAATVPLAGCNLADFDLSVGATVIGKTSGKFKLATSKPAATATTNTGLVYFEIKAVDDLAYSATPDASYIGNFKGEDIVEALKNWENTGYKATEKNQVLVGAKAVTKTGMVTLNAAEEDSNGELVPVDGSYFVARLSGNVVKFPKLAWDENDGVDVTISWIIEPGSSD